MRAVFYPAVLERGEGEAYAIWFPDFPDVVAGDVSQSGAMAKAEAVLIEAAEELALQGKLLPAPSDLDGFEVPEDCDLVVRFAVRVTPPDLSERVNVYLPKSLIERVDERAAAMGMSRSSYFGWALTQTLGVRAMVEAGLKRSR
jgi:predicted RNase H-like HicB family nuclease